MAILGEFRTIPGYTVGEVLGSFYKEYHTLLEKAKKNGLEIAIKNYEEVPADLWEAHSDSRFSWHTISISQAMFQETMA
ncbi:MAG TPA: hypothetical protein DCL60_11090 [Armatimonadetes bacterium]|nr:hypothetical protein [Armatimonadota bacterium]